MQEGATTRVERIKYGRKDTSTLLCEGEDLTIYKDGEGVILECFVYGTKGDPHHGYRMRLSADAKAKLKGLLA